MGLTSEWFGSGLVVSGDVGWWLQCREYPVNLIFGRALSPFFSDSDMNAAGLDLGSYPETRATEWKQWLGLWRPGLTVRVPKSWWCSTAALFRWLEVSFG